MSLSAPAIDLASYGSMLAKYVYTTSVRGGKNGAGTRSLEWYVSDASNANPATALFTSSGTASSLAFTSSATNGMMITGVNGVPTNPSDVTNKLYVDSVAQGLYVKNAVKLGTAAVLPACAYNNGTSGVGATLTETATTGSLIIDGVTLTSADVGARILVKDQASGSQNGVYTVTAMTASSSWVLTRANDYDTSPEMQAGTFMFVTEGTANADKGFVQITTGTITIGTTALAFTQFSAANSYSSGAGISSLAGSSVVKVNVTSTANVSPLGFSDGNYTSTAGSSTTLQLFSDPSATTKTGSVLRSESSKTTEPSYSYQVGPTTTALATSTQLFGVSPVASRPSTGSVSDGGFVLYNTNSVTNGEYSPSLYIGGPATANTWRETVVGDGTDANIMLQRTSDGSTWTTLFAVTA